MPGRALPWRVWLAVSAASVLALVLVVASLMRPALGLGLLGALLIAGLVAAVALSKRDAAAVLTVMVFLLFLLPENYVLVGPLRSVGNPALLVAMGCLAAWLVASAQRQLTSSRNHPIHWLMYMYATVAAVAFAAAMMRPLTAIESSGVTRAIFPVLGEVGIALLACDAIAKRDRLDALLYRLVLIVAVASGIGILEFAASSFKYIDVMHLPGLTINTDVISDVRSSFRRVQAAAAHPIEYAVGCACVVPLGLHYATHASTRAHRQLAGLATVAMLAVLPMTVSRSGILAVGVALIVYAVHWSNRTRLNAIVVAGLGVVAFRAVVPGLLGTLRSLFTVGTDDPSIAGRTEDYANIPGLMEGHWIFGRGLGTFQPAQYFFLDNQYLGSLLEGGAIELAALVVLFVVGMGIARGARKAATDPATRSLGQAIAAAIAGLAVSAVTFDEMGFKQTGFLLFLLIGAGGALWKMARDDSEFLRSMSEEFPDTARHVTAPTR